MDGYIDGCGWYLAPVRKLVATMLAFGAGIVLDMGRQLAGLFEYMGADTVRNTYYFRFGDYSQVLSFSLLALLARLVGVRMMPMLCRVLTGL